MGIKLEGLVRPFMDRNISPPKVSGLPTSTDSEPTKTVSFEWGKGGGFKTISINYSSQVELYMTKQQREKASNSGGGGSDPFAPDSNFRQTDDPFKTSIP